ncbi:MAG: hypothetical protein MOB07_11715 [Acidobacteria bacterium]|nr:hypothetical protein [Acidobacteriota bacterium]MCI0661371.1 hypothetical protein [Acidobacteriota bacterium]
MSLNYARVVTLQSCRVTGRNNSRRDRSGVENAPKLAAAPSARVLHPRPPQPGIENTGKELWASFDFLT